ncbi:cilia- and flagella-associated protein 90-like [Antedon mediterranea]|uniref:cilia- and flagella-associated protein 90-like n=1 Tax=Antedon mediterranea TaxID=105859 RepID=UPI003AF48B89
MEKQRTKKLGEYPGLMDKGEPLAAKSAFSYVPTVRKQPAERTVFNSTQELEGEHSTFDQLFNWKEGYNNKLHRCDREHAKLRGLYVNEEEQVKDVPTLSSSVYGHKLELFNDPPGRAHVRVGHVKTEFYRRNGVNIEGDMEGM